MRMTQVKHSCEQKSKMLDDIAEIIINCENGVMEAPAEIIKRYKTPASWAGYKIMSYLFEHKVIEPGGEQETLNL